MARIDRSATQEHIFARLEEAIASGPRRDEQRKLPDSALAAHIVDRHHDYARRVLPYIVSLLPKVAGFYGKRNAKLSDLCDTGNELADALDAHQEETERALFPALRSGGSRLGIDRGKLEELSGHHRAIAQLLARVRWLADDFSAPDWGGRSYSDLMEELAALEENVIEHMRLERHVLMPRLERAQN